MATAVSLSAELGLPGSTGLTAQSIPFAFSGEYSHKAEFDISLTGAGTHNVNFGTVGKAKIAVIQHVAPDSGTAVPVNLRFNGGVSDSLELSTGGFMVYANPNPSAGVTAIAIVSTAAARVIIWLLG